MSQKIKFEQMSYPNDFETNLQSLLDSLLRKDPMKRIGHQGVE